MQIGKKDIEVFNSGSSESGKSCRSLSMGGKSVLRNKNPSAIQEVKEVKVISYVQQSKR